jgi:hypothetical protein
MANRDVHLIDVDSLLSDEGRLVQNTVREFVSQKARPRLVRDPDVFTSRCC